MMEQASPFLLIVKGDLEYAAGDLKRSLHTCKKARGKDETIG